MTTSVVQAELQGAEEPGIAEHDEGPERSTPLRTCIVARERMPIDRLIRFVADPDGLVIPDLKRKLPGRGVWVEARHAAVCAAIKRKAFARGLRRELRAEPDLADLTQSLLERDALQALALANKAGAVIAGHAKVEAAIMAGNVRAVLHGADAAPDGIRKIAQALRRTFGDEKWPLVIAPFQSTQMSLCLGREHVIHACLANSAASEPVLAKCLLFLRYRGLPEDWGATHPDVAFGSESSDPGLLAMKKPDL